MFAALDYNGVMSWTSIEGTCSRKKFHNAFSDFFVPYLNPWPSPKSIFVLDNAKIHMLKELEGLLRQFGARLLFFPPYSPEINPIEVFCGLLKC